MNTLMRALARVLAEEQPQELPKPVLNFFRAWDNWVKDKALEYSREPAVKDFLSKYQPKHAMKLYRGLKYETEHKSLFEKFLGTEVKEGVVFDYSDKQLSSWTTDISHIEYGDFHCDEVCKYGVILEATVPQNLLLVDFSLIPEDLAKLLALRNEGEVIVQPGKFQAKIKSLSTYKSE
jgi:hypothetical protein